MIFWKTIFESHSNVKTLPATIPMVENGTGYPLLVVSNVLLVLATLALFGGEMIFGFAIALIVGVGIGTYSSIYVAASTLMLMGVSKEDLMIPVKEGVDQESLTP